MRQSLPARCQHDLGGFHGVCGSELKLHITRSPLAGWDYLVVERCPEHVSRVQGVLPEVVERYEDDDAGDCDAPGIW